MKQVKWIYFDKHCEIMQKINGRTQPFRFSVFTVGRHEIFVENIGNSCAKNHFFCKYVIRIFKTITQFSLTFQFDLDQWVLVEAGGSLGLRRFLV